LHRLSLDEPPRPVGVFKRREVGGASPGADRSYGRVFARPL